MAILLNENVLVDDNPYTLARGKLMVREATDPSDQWLDLAHVKEVTINIATETLEHKSSRGGLKVRDRITTTELTAGGSAIVDLPIVENVKLFFMGKTTTTVAQIAGSWVAEAFTLAANRWTFLTKYRIDPDIAFVVTNVGGATTYTEDVDYEVDREGGFLAPIDGGLITVFDVEVTGTYLADERRRVVGGEVTNQKRHVWFVGDSADGVDQDIRGFCNLVPSGDLSMIGDDWQEFTLSLDFETNSAYAGILEYFDKGLAA